MPYSNGRVPESALTKVEPGNWLAKPQARALNRLKAAAVRAGYTVWVIDPDGGYRDLATQRDMHLHPGAHNIDPRMQVRLAPVGASTHGLATSADLAISGGERGWAWLLDNAPRYGWTRTFGPLDPHHFGHDGHTATALLKPPAKRLYAVVQKDDTLTGIADDVDTTVQKLLLLNPDTRDPKKIQPGQKIRIR